VLEFPCPRCGRQIKASRKLMGRRGQCPKCKQSVTVPVPADWQKRSAPNLDAVAAESLGTQQVVSTSLDDMNTEDIEQVLTEPPPLPRLPVPANAILVADVPNQPPSRAFYATLCAAVGLLAVVVAFIAGTFWRAGSESTDEQTTAVNEPAKEKPAAELPMTIASSDERGFTDWTSALPGEKEEAFRALRELVKQVLGEEATFADDSPGEASLDFIDSTGGRYWRLRGRRLAEIPEEADSGLNYIAIIWLEPNYLEQWHLAWFNYQGNVLHDNRAEEYRDYINSRIMSDAEIREWNTTYFPDRSIAVKRNWLYPPIHELDEASKRAIYPGSYWQKENLPPLAFPRP